jgi:metal-dependent HD superfamily phosphatase/phosphodiesterase
MSGGIRINSLALAKCIGKHGIPEQVIKDALGDIEGLDFDMVTFQLRKKDWQAEQIIKARTKMLGLAHAKEVLDNIAPELFGQKTGDADATALAGPIAKAFGSLRTTGGTMPAGA